MAETRIIKAVFGASKSIVAPKRFKNDWGQVLELVGITLPQTFTAHFANSRTGTAKKRIGQNNQVDVPDEFFTSGADIFCWVMVHDTVSDGRTMYTVRIPIEDRGTATDEEPTPVQQDVIEQAIAALNSAVEKTAQDVESADASAQSAKADADRAETARDTAEEYVDDVQEYAQQAQASAFNAASSATSSASSASQAQQMKTDVQELVSDAQSAAGASAQSALESDQSASQASTFATFASQSAETASTKASEASASAQTASTKATEASGYASTASAKASESSQSASAASGYATQAGQAKTAAETAQGLAEQAQTDAESAKDDAESARDEAQQIVSGISGKVEQIDQNTADIASLEAERYKTYVTDTATGAVASFPDGADNIPMKDVTVQIEPVQDLSHGAPSPDNICPISGWTGCNVSHSGADTSDATVYPITFPVEAGTVYGGTLDVTTGELVVDTAMVDLGTLVWDIDGNRFKASVAGMPNKAGRTIKMLCDCYKSLVNGEAYDQNANNVCYGAYSRVYVHDFAYTDTSIFKTAVTGHQLVYELTTPVTYQLTPTEIRSLLGQNNIFADTGDSTVEYRADTKLYIQKKITEAVNALA